MPRLFPPLSNYKYRILFKKGEYHLQWRWGIFWITADASHPSYAVVKASLDQYLEKDKDYSQPDHIVGYW